MSIIPCIPLSNPPRIALQPRSTDHTPADSPLGTGFTLSLATIPAILQSPTPLLLKQWRVVFDIGKSTAPPLAVLAAATLSYVAYTKYNISGSDTTQWRGLAIAAAGTVGIVPFTLLFMGGINDKLITASDAVGKEVASESVRELVARWGRVNVVRSFLTLGATMVGIWSVLE